MIEWLVFAVVGRVLIFVWQKLQLPFKNDWLQKLHDCALCSGVWIYGILAVGFGVDIFSSIYVPSLIGELSTGVITSYLVFYFVAGWKSVHEVIEI